jgi:hypothetical protein
LDMKTIVRAVFLVILVLAIAACGNPGLSDQNFASAGPSTEQSFDSGASGTGGSSETSIDGTGGGSTTIPADPADPGVRPAIPAVPGEGDPELCPDGSYAPCETYSGDMVAMTRSGLMRIDGAGNVTAFNSSVTGAIEVRDGRLYAMPGRTSGSGKSILELDQYGNIIGTITVPSEATYYLNFTALPEGGFALLDNSGDKIYFIDDLGNYITTVNIRSVRDYHLQNVHGVVVGGRLIVSEDGEKNLLAVDLDTYAVTVFKDLSGLGSSWLNVIDYYEGLYYLTNPGSIYTFTESEWPSPLAEGIDYNITSLLIKSDGYIYVTVNFSGKVYRIDRATGESQLFVSGLDYPQDMEEF